MRFASCTHSFGGDQKFVSVPFTPNGANLTATGPPDGTIAPLGFYMLWLPDGDNFPCQHAWTIRVKSRLDLKPTPFSIPSSGRKNMKGMMEGREVSVPMRKPTERRNWEADGG